MSGIELFRVRKDAGDPPLVFVHGYLCNHDHWRHQIPHFAPRHTALACDLRGHGRSPRGTAEMSIETLGADVADMLAAEDLRGAVLIGHSMGCRVVLETCRRAPDRVAGLVLVDGSRSGDAASRKADQARYDAAIAELGYRDCVRRAFDSMFLGEPPAWKEPLMEGVLAVPEEIGRPLFRNLLGWDLEAALAQIRVPVLVLQSTAMNAARQRYAMAAGETSPYQALLLERLADCRSVTIPAGHFSMLEVPGVVNAEIERFIVSLIPYQ